jgi:hypothetical protein
MKRQLLLLFLPLFLLGCSKKVPVTTVFPISQIHVVTTQESNEQVEIKRQAMALLEARNYDQLEAVAAKYRSSGEGYADGVSKLFVFYQGLEANDKDSEAIWKDRQGQIQQWIQAMPTSVTARVGMGWFLTVYAWHARGSGWASTVNDENEKIFEDRLQQAVQVLNQALQLKDKCPVCWTAMQKAALGLGFDRSRYDDLFTQAVEAFPDYDYFYRSRAVFLLPRWYGKEGEWESDLAKSADKVGGEKGDLVYARGVWSIRHYGDGIDVFADKGVSWERVDRGFEVILKQYPESLAAKTERAQLAGLAGNSEMAKKYLIQTKGEVDLGEWQAQGEYEDFYKWAFGQ